MVALQYVLHKKIVYLKDDIIFSIWTLILQNSQNSRQHLQKIQYHLIWSRASPSYWVSRSLRKKIHVFRDFNNSIMVPLKVFCTTVIGVWKKSPERVVKTAPKVTEALLTATEHFHHSLCRTCNIIRDTSHPSPNCPSSLPFIHMPMYSLNIH